MEYFGPLAGFPSDGGEAPDVLGHFLHGEAGGAPLPLVKVVALALCLKLLLQVFDQVALALSVLLLHLDQLVLGLGFLVKDGDHSLLLLDLAVQLGIELP